MTKNNSDIIGHLLQEVFTERDGLEDCLTVLDFPECHRRRLRSTNMLENLMKRLKARTKVVGVFPNRSSCDRLIGSLLLEVHEQWSLDEKAYFNR